MEINREIFDQQRRPRFGIANPERMQMVFWEWMILGDESQLKDMQGGLAELGFIMREGKLKSTYGPYRARDHFKVPLSRNDGPIWTFDRIGATRTALADGRTICIAGEHEDYYDPDFCIYNDVVVLGPQGQLEIYGYPKEVFPPTDFHTATLVKDQLFIVGCLGYQDSRRSGHTPVYILDLSGYGFSEMKTSGEMPVWVYEHDANFDPEGFITVRRGHIIHEREGKQLYRRNFNDYALDIKSGIWRCLTSRNWGQFRIRPEDRKLFVLKDRPDVETFIPRGAKRLGRSSVDSEFVLFLIDGFPVSVKVGIADIEVIIEEDLLDKVSAQIAELIRASVEATIQQACEIQRV